MSDALNETARAQVARDRAGAQAQVRLLGELLARPMPGIEESALRTATLARDAFIRELAK